MVRAPQVSLRRGGEQPRPFATAPPSAAPGHKRSSDKNHGSQHALFTLRSRSLVGNTRWDSHRDRRIREVIARFPSASAFVDGWPSAGKTLILFHPESD